MLSAAKRIGSYGLAALMCVAALVIACAAMCMQPATALAESELTAGTVAPQDDGKELWAEFVKDNGSTTSTIRGTLYIRYDSGFESSTSKWKWTINEGGYATVNDVPWHGSVSGGSSEDDFPGSSGVKYVDIQGTSPDLKSMAHWFDDCRNLESVTIANGAVSSSVTNYTAMFHDCVSLKTISLSSLITSQATDFQSMFEGCSALTSIDLTPLASTTKQNFQSMFHGCAGLTSIDLTPLNMTEATNVTNMFQGCSKLRTMKVGAKTKLTDGNVIALDSAWPDATKAECAGYTGNWIGKFNDDSSIVVCTPQQFAERYGAGGTNREATWTWQVGPVTKSSITGNEASYSGYWVVYYENTALGKAVVVIQQGDGQLALDSEYLKPIAGADNTALTAENLTVEKYTGFIEFPYATRSVADGENNIPWLKDGRATKIVAAYTNPKVDASTNAVLVNSAGAGTQQVFDCAFPVMTYWFANCANLEKAELQHLNTSQTRRLPNTSNITSTVTDLSYMFDECRSLNSLDISGMNVSTNSTGGLTASNVSVLQTDMLKSTALTKIKLGPNWRFVCSENTSSGTTTSTGTSLPDGSASDNGYWVRFAEGSTSASTDPEIKYREKAEKLMKEYGSTSGGTAYDNPNAKFTNWAGTFEWYEGSSTSYTLAVEFRNYAVANESAANAWTTSLSTPYNGSPQTPAFRVKMTKLVKGADGKEIADKREEAILQKDVDYTVGGWSSNTNAGAATLTLKQKTDSTSKLAGMSASTFTSQIGSNNFTIAKLDLSKYGSMDKMAEQPYTYNAIYMQPTVRAKKIVNGQVKGTLTLQRSSNYSLSWLNIARVGTATVTARGSGNYTGSVSGKFQIKNAIGYSAKLRGSSKWQATKYPAYPSGSNAQNSRPLQFRMSLGAKPYTGGVTYRTRVTDASGWGAWKKDGAASGTTNKNASLEAIQIKLYGEMAKHYDIYYRVYTSGYGWTGWAKNGGQVGTGSMSYRIRYLEVQMVPKNGMPQGSTTNLFHSSAIQYRTHVQNVGWQPYVYDGAMAGTTGRSLRLEGINIKLSPFSGISGGIQYRTHIQNIGWEKGWKKNGAMSGTSGRSLRLEAIQIKLTGAAAKKYDVYYRVHCQNIGWMGWAKNGARAGSAGYSYRLEGIQIKLVAKGAKAPGSTRNAFRQRR